MPTADADEDDLGDFTAAMPTAMHMAMPAALPTAMLMAMLDAMPKTATPLSTLMGMLPFLPPPTHTPPGDKTFCIAAVMAMRYNRLLVFGGAALALLVMTVLSVAIGSVMPALLPKTYTHYAAAALFAYFGAKLLSEARAMAAGGESHGELAEAEQEVAEKALQLKGASGGGGGSSNDPPSNGGGDVEAPDETAVTVTAGSGRSGGSGTPSVAGSQASDSDADNADPSAKSGSAKRLAAKHALSSAGAAAELAASWSRDCPIFTTAFSVTFLAEWGDRSQIATIAMAAAQDPVGVCIGSSLGHALCTGLAVIGGRLLASRISERAVAFFGGLLFLLFAAHSMWVGPDVDE